MAKVLVVEDDAELNRTVCSYLRLRGHDVLDADEHAAYLSGEPVELTLREFDVLWKLLANPRKVFTRSQLAGEPGVGSEFTVVFPGAAHE